MHYFECLRRPTTILLICEDDVARSLMKALLYQRGQNCDLLMCVIRSVRTKNPLKSHLLY